MNRLAAIVVVLLIGGTAAAFAYTQGLKQTKSPIFATQVTKQFSRYARIAFGLRRDDHVSIEILSAHGDVVRTLVADLFVRKSFRGFTWDGRGDDGQRLPDGVYKVRVDLQDADRTIDLPNRIVLDTVPPRITGASTRVTATLLRVSYRFDGQAEALLFVNHTRRVRSNSIKPIGHIDLARRFIPKGAVIELVARDLAGNLSKPRVLKPSLLP